MLCWTGYRDEDDEEDDSRSLILIAAVEHITGMSLLILLRADIASPSQSGDLSQTRVPDFGEVDSDADGTARRSAHCATQAKQIHGRSCVVNLIG